MHQNERILVAASLILAVLATNGCDQAIDPPSDTRAPVQDLAAPMPQRENRTAEAMQGEQAQGPEELRADIAAIQLQETALQIERERIARRVESHQVAGDGRLAALKEQWKAFDGKSPSDPDRAAARERFAERARVEMESALMMDEENRAQLQENEEKLRQTQQQLREMRTRQAGLDAVVVQD